MKNIFSVGTLFLILSGSSAFSISTGPATAVKKCPPPSVALHGYSVIYGENSLGHSATKQNFCCLEDIYPAPKNCSGVFVYTGGEWPSPEPKSITTHCCIKQ